MRCDRAVRPFRGGASAARPIGSPCAVCSSSLRAETCRRCSPLLCSASPLRAQERARVLGAVQSAPPHSEGALVESTPLCAGHLRSALARSSASRCERTRPCVRAQSRTPAQKGTPRTWFNTIRRGRSAIRRSGQGSHRQRRCATALSQTARVGMAACRSASLSATKRRRARQARRRWRRRRAAELFPSASVMRGSWWRRWTERAFLCACARARVWELVSRCMSARVLAR